MENLTIDYGMKEFAVNGGAILRFNPSDPNLYSRFKKLGADISAMEKEVATSEGDTIDLMNQFDKRVKAMLAQTFGPGNDFDAIFEGVNVMGLACNNELVITNFLNALRPVVEAGAKSYAKMEAQKAVQQANAERAAR